MNGQWKLQLDREPGGRILLLMVYIGIIVGAVLANLLYHADATVLEPFFLDTYYASVVRDLQYDRVLWRILPARLVEILIYIIIYSIFHVTLISYFMIAVIGTFWGFLISLEIIRMGIQGFLLGFLCLVPHSLLYSLAIIHSVQYQEEIKIKKCLPIFIYLLLALAAEILAEPLLLARFLS